MRTVMQVPGMRITTTRHEVLRLGPLSCVVYAQAEQQTSMACAAQLFSPVRQGGTAQVDRCSSRARSTNQATPDAGRVQCRPGSGRATQSWVRARGVVGAHAGRCWCDRLRGGARVVIRIVTPATTMTRLRRSTRRASREENLSRLIIARPSAGLRWTVTMRLATRSPRRVTARPTWTATASCRLMPGAASAKRLDARISSCAGLGATAPICVDVHGRGGTRRASTLVGCGFPRVAAEVGAPWLLRLASGLRGAAWRVGLEDCMTKVVLVLGDSPDRVEWLKPKCRRRG